MNQTRNRIVRTGTISPADIRRNPLNARVHGEAQRRSMRAILGKIGYVSGVIISERTGLLLDGHMRVDDAETNGDEEVPAQFVDVDEDEERLILATYDPLGDLATTDAETMSALLGQIGETEDGAIAELLSSLGSPDFEGVDLPDDREDPDDPAEWPTYETQPPPVEGAPPAYVKSFILTYAAPEYEDLLERLAVLPGASNAEKVAKLIRGEE